MTKIYQLEFGRKQTGVEDLNLEVEEGQIFGLVGPNGSGKTTTLKLLLGLVFPTSGTGEVLGFPIGHPAYKERIGFLPEGPYFYDHLNAVELLRFYGGLFGLGGKELDRRVQELLELVGMWDRRHIRVRNYSRGMLQRVGVAQALINDPDLIFLDEPTSGLDPLGAMQIREVITRIRDQGKTVFLCSHLLKEMEPLCDNIAILNRGRVVQSGTVDELLAGPQGMYMLRAHTVPQEVVESLRSFATEVRTWDSEIEATFADQKLAAQALEAVVEAGGTVRELSPYRRSLEEVFIDAVGGEAQ
ncbi:MAG: ABC transporter ATP-binding protein [Armatimonadetes bacterium]|nr:ABC transporter ATP-binding protein [Armatimonadota bacterium]